MKRFLAKLVFQLVSGSGNPSSQFDERLRMIDAEDELHAFYKARLLGESDEVKAETEGLANVYWKFIDVTALHLLACDTDGTEIYSVIKEEADANLYIRSIHKTATQLLQRGLHQFTGLNSMVSGS
jgi:hypothetical protein